MSGFSLASIAAMTAGRLVGEWAAERICPYGRISIDSRRLEPGDLFAAIRAERDGHAFVGAAAEAGACAALVEEGAEVRAPDRFPLIRVDAAVPALHRWAAAHRRRVGATVIAVTGSSGKTTAKDRLLEILARVGPAHGTPGNLNNEIGVPITLLGIAPEHRWAVVEIAMNRPGEIAPLSRLAAPHHVLITTVGWAHIGAFGTREGILKEKLDALRGMAAGGTFFHGYDPWVMERLPEEARALPRQTFGMEADADLHPEEVSFRLDETLFRTPETGPVRYRCPGRGALLGALAASLVARALGAGGAMVARAMEDARPRPLRMEPRPLLGGTALLDCYNASPESSLMAVEFLLSVPVAGRRWLVFGEMRELGDRSAEAHRNLGAAAAPLDGAFFLGEGCAPALDAFRKTASGDRYCVLHTNVEACARDLRARLAGGDAVLFKGSRLMAVERVYEACLRTAGSAGR